MRQCVRASVSLAWFFNRSLFNVYIVTTDVFIISQILIDDDTLLKTSEVEVNEVLN